MRNAQKPFLFLGVALLTFACGIPFNIAPSNSEPNPDLVGTIAAQTAVAAQMKTLEAIPPSQTLIPTSTATKTATSIPSPTPTILFIFPTETLVVFPALEDESSEDTGPQEHNYKGTIECALVGKSPRDGTIFLPREKFTVHWTIKNTGTASWKKGWIDYRYLGGDKFHDRSLYDMNWILDPGQTIDLKVPMNAPKQPGSYETTWVVGLSKDGLCKMTLAIIVRKKE